jgi:hypothetical protein
MFPSEDSIMFTMGILVFVLLLLSFLLLIFYQNMSMYHPPGPSFEVLGTTMAPLVVHCDASEEECPLHVKRVHLVVLVHGFIGCPQDLAYVRHALERQASQALLQGGNSSNEHFIIHNCEANHGRTWDGVEAGAQRVSEEIQQVLRNIQERFEDLEEVSFSMLGYSLGGMYARAALPDLFPSDEGTSCSIRKLTPKVFCTLATPHLGSQGHTYVGLPRFLENIVGRFSQTSKDLFRQNSLLDDMVHQPKFFQPLLRFEKRIAYSNTHAMDVMVPTSTGAFLSETSNFIHHHKASQQHACMSLSVETCAQHALFSNPNYHNLEMSQKLDAMGWTKVFADFLGCGDAVQVDTAVPRSAVETSYTSSELLSRFGGPKKRFFLPMGHDLLAVNSKNVLYSYVMQRGRPMVDQLARDLIDDILREP